VTCRPLASANGAISTNWPATGFWWASRNSSASSCCSPYRAGSTWIVTCCRSCPISELTGAGMAPFQYTRTARSSGLAVIEPSWSPPAASATSEIRIAASCSPACTRPTSCQEANPAGTGSVMSCANRAPPAGTPAGFESPAAAVWAVSVLVARPAMLAAAAMAASNARCPRRVW
jgi:hypothetical protein